MPGTRTDYGQMYDHELNPRKGWSGDRGTVLEKVLPIKTGTVYAGTGVTIDSTANAYVVGPQTETASQFHPPLFAFQNQNDFDVNPDLGNIAGGVVMALSCLGDFELESTEIKAGETFAAGKPLGLHTDGKLMVAALGTNTICGIVSETGPNTAPDGIAGTFNSEYGKPFLRFWTYYLPACAAHV